MKTPNSNQSDQEVQQFATDEFRGHRSARMARARSGAGSRKPDRRSYAARQVMAPSLISMLGLLAGCRPEPGR